MMTQLTVTGPYVNKTLFEQANVPLPGAQATWDQWVDASRKVAKATQVPFAVAFDRSGHRFAGPAISMGSKYFAIPWAALTLDTDEKRFILGVSKDRLENAPGFDKDHWPSMADATWATELHSYYNVTPYWEDYNLDTARDRRSTPDDLTSPRTY